MESADHRKALLLHAAQALAKSHGIFYAAALLADSSIPIQVALKVLVDRRSTAITPLSSMTIAGDIHISHRAAPSH